jgi:hypothetical protein
MRIFLIALLAIGLSFSAFAEDLKDSQKTEDSRELKKLEKLDDAHLMKTFMAHTWVVIVPDFEKQNKQFKDATGKDLNIRVHLVTHPKTSEVHIEILNDIDPSQNFESDKVKVKFNNDKLHFVNNGTVVAKVYQKDGKLFYIPMKEDGTAGNTLEMKVKK